jgi:hypothetical protein
MTLDDLAVRMLPDDLREVIRRLEAAQLNFFKPSLTICPAGEEQPYLYRWHITPRNDLANTYLHIQVASDPERPLHDHPWFNTSTILAGGYDEIWDADPANSTEVYVRRIRKGATVFRQATEAHRLILPEHIPYSVSWFTTGLKSRDWGFWYPDGFHPHAQHIEDRDGKSFHVHKGDDNAFNE